MNINQLTADKIKELRLKAGLTADFVAQSLHITRGAYSQMENGKTAITLTRLEALAVIFNVSVSELIPVSNNPQTFNGNNSVNGNHNTNTILNNFFSHNPDSLDAVMKVIENALKGKTN